MRQVTLNSRRSGGIHRRMLVLPATEADDNARPDGQFPADFASRSMEQGQVDWRKTAATAPMKAPGPPLLKADTSDGGEGWSNSQIAAALETSVDTVAWTRQRLVEEGFDAALTRKDSPNSARRRIFDGAAEARLIALACSTPPKGEHGGP